jgi:hypothetical protein
MPSSRLLLPSIDDFARAALERGDVARPTGQIDNRIGSLLRFRQPVPSLRGRTGLRQVSAGSENMVPRWLSTRISRSRMKSAAIKPLTIMRDHPAGIRSVVLDSVLPPTYSVPANWWTIRDGAQFLR